MRYTRKLRGGNEAETIKECAPRQTNDGCIDDFLVEKQFVRVPVEDDGNCFFHTLTEFFKRSKNSSIPNSYHLVLRNKIVDYLLANIDKVAPYFSEKNNKNTFEQIEELRTEGLWFADAFDNIVPYMARSLKLNIKIYDLKAATKAKKRTLAKNKEGRGIKFNIIPAQPKRIVMYNFPSDSNTDPTVHMLRTSDSHFELLWPDKVEARQPKKTSATKKASSPKPPAGGPGRSRSSSPKPPAGGPGRSRSSSPKAAAMAAQPSRYGLRSKGKPRSPSPPKIAAKPAPAPKPATRQYGHKKPAVAANVYNENAALAEAIAASLKLKEEEEQLRLAASAAEEAGSFFNFNKNK